ncbi:MAG: phosphodiester glycosidase family protein [Chloroflexi bacterium]|jgi:hypothetical protein|nr:phosphodiester glycosidase family protein [Chloroflexota bacterium]
MTNDFPVLTKKQQTITHADGSFSEVITFDLPADRLVFRDICQSDRGVRLNESADFRWLKAVKRGADRPMVVAFNRLERDEPLSRSLPELDPGTEDGEVLLSTNSFLTYVLRKAFEQGWVRIKGGQWQPAVPADQQVWQKRLQACLDLSGPDGILFSRGPFLPVPEDVDFSQDQLDVQHDLAPVDRFGFLVDEYWRSRPRLIFNTSYFLLEDEDYFSFHSGMGEAYNLWVGDGVVERPPLYRRGAFFQKADGRWEVGSFDLNDLAIILPENIELAPAGMAQGEQIPFLLNPQVPGDVNLYTRYFGAENGAQKLPGRTLEQAGALELLVVDRRIVSWKRGGRLELPQNGFAISFSPGALSAAVEARLLAALKANITLSYRFVRPEYVGIREAIQTGPVLVKDGAPYLTNRDVVREEQFWPSRMIDGQRVMGVVPTDFDSRLDSARHPRAALGVRPDGSPVLVMVEGVSKGGGIAGKDSMGATLTELAGYLIQAGAQQAVNLDGGGSAQALLYGGRAITPGERRGFERVSFDRMVPSVGIIRR